MEEKVTPNALLSMSRDLGLIDAFGEEEDDRVWISQAGRIRYYTTSEAEQLLDEMMLHAPMLRKITEHLPRSRSTRGRQTGQTHTEGER